MKHHYNLHPWLKPLLSVVFLSISLIFLTNSSPTFAAVNDTNPILFTVNIPAIFRQNITATNILYSLNGGTGFTVTSGQTPTLTNTGVLSLQGETGKLSLTAGDGIALEGLKIINTGIKSLSSGDGISVDGNKITNSGIVSLTAGDGISVDGNKITNNQILPDYTLSGWTKEGSLVSLTTPTDSVDMNSVTFGNALITNGKSIIPTSDLSVDLGSSALRFDSLWVANINSNSSQSFSGQTTFSYPPQDSTINETTVLINPENSSPSGQLLGLSVNGFQKAFFDIAGNLILGYSGLSSAPTTNNPLNIYGHSDSLVASFDTDGHLTMGNTLTPANGTLTIASSVNTNSLNVDSGTLSVTDKVGIGTTTPTQMLTVNGGLDTTSLLSPNLINRSSENTRINFDSTTTSLITNGNTGIFLDSTGNVGIGTTEPNSYKLNVAGTANFQGAVTAENALNIQGQTTLSALSAGTTNISGSLTLNGPINSVSGFLGLGTLTPSSQLDIQAAYGTSALALTNTGNTILGMDAATNGLAMNLTTQDPTNKILNGTFETGISNWSGTQPYILRDEFSDAGPTTLVSGVSTLTNSGTITPVIGEELVLNGNMESGNPPSNWSSQNGATLTSVSDQRPGGSGSLSINVRNGSGDYGTAIQNYAFSSGYWYQMSGWAKNITAPAYLGTNLYSTSQAFTDSWTFKYFTFKATTDNRIYLRNYDATLGKESRYDDISVKPLTLSSLFSTVDAGNQNVVASTSATLTAGTQAGLVLNLDSTSNPQNFVIAYHDGTNMHLDKAVAGTYTSLINTATTYVAGANITVRKNGTRYTLVYNGTQVGTDQTISDAGIVNNTIHGLFSTYSSNSFSNFSITTNLDGTLATDGVNIRRVKDRTSNQITITNGLASQITSYSDDGLTSGSISRTVGRLLAFKGKILTGNTLIGWFGTNGTAGGSWRGTFEESYIRRERGSPIQVQSDGLGTDDSSNYSVVWGNDSQYFFKNNKLVYHSTQTPELTTLYPGFNTALAGRSGTLDYLRVPAALWLPTPLAYDTFTATGSATTESTGPDGQATPQLTWTGGAKANGTMSITPTFGDELLTNGDMENGNPPTDWTPQNNGVLSGAAEERDGGIGLQSLSVARSGNNSGAASQAVTSVTGSWYSLSVWSKLIEGISNYFLIRNTSGFGTVLSQTPATTSASWVQKNITGRAISTTTSVWNYINASVDGQSSLFDGVSFRSLATPSLFSTIQTNTSDLIVGTNVTLTLGTQAGLVLNLDSTTNPQNFIIVYSDGTNIKVEQSVAGIYTTKSTTAHSSQTALNYADGRKLGAIKDGNKLRVYYNDTLVTSELTMSANTNTIHGLFSTYSGNTFDNFTLWSRGTGGEYNDIPADDITVTQDTSIKRSGVASAKLVAGTSNANFLQSTTVGDTNTYTLTTYAFEATSSAVNSSDLELFYDGAIIPTTYADMGSGWYRLQGTITGSTDPKDIGVRVKAGKTIYLDNITLTSGISTPTTMYVFNSSTGKANLNVQGLIDGTLSGIATFSKAGTISDSDFTSTASGMLAVDTLNHRLYFREADGWSYIARTGGFQIPAEEVGDMQERDLLLPYVESKMSDGALHGLYTKLSDIMTGGTATISKYTDHVDIKFTKPFSSTPVINISLINESLEDGFLTEGHEATVTDLSPTGFSIYLGANALRDYTYSWTVLQIPKVITTTPSND